MSPRAYDWHDFKLEERDLEPRPVFYNLGVMLTAEEFTPEGDDTYWFKGSIDGEVLLADGSDHFTRVPIRAQFEGLFGGTKPSLFGDG